MQAPQQHIPPQAPPPPPPVPPAKVGFKRATRDNPRPFREVTPEGNLRLNFHAGQWRAWNSTARIIAIIAGTQSGKTVFGAHWLLREITLRGQGDYMVVTPTFPLLELKALKEFRYVFENLWQLGTYYSSPIRKFVFSAEGMERVHGADFDAAQPTTVYFGYADNPDSLESATVKGIWADEAGQKRFRLQSFEALRRRASIHRARILFTTTPYDIGWLYSEIFRRWKRRERDRRGRLLVEVVNFASIMNPLFPREEFEEARATLPRWKFAMFYLGLFMRPAGLIYDAFRPKVMSIEPIEIQSHWPRFLGIDFGAPNIAGVFLAMNPQTRMLYAYREYRPRQTFASKEHVRRLLRGENYSIMREAELFHGIGGSRSETQWRVEFEEAGLELIPSPIHEVEVGIDRVYGVMKANRLRVFNTCTGLLDELASYSRVTDAQGNPTAKIADKEKYHLADALRYAIAEAENPDHDVTDEEIASKINPDRGLGVRDEDDEDSDSDSDEWSKLAVDGDQLGRTRGIARSRGGRR